MEKVNYVIYIFFLVLLSLLVFRTFWSSFLVLGVVSVVIGGLVVLCAAPLSNQKLYKVGGAFQLSGGEELPFVKCFFWRISNGRVTSAQHASPRE